MGTELGGGVRRRRTGREWGGLKVITPLIRLQEALSCLWEFNSFPRSFFFSFLSFFLLVQLVLSLNTSFRLSLTNTYIHRSITTYTQ
jgi:hypothetical protein